MHLVRLMYLMRLMHLMRLMPLLRTFLRKYSRIVSFISGEAVSGVFIKVKADKEKAWIKSIM
jgi:hypothetical protein